MCDRRQHILDSFCQGLISIFMSFFIALHTSSISSLVRAIQPSVKSTQRWNFPTQLNFCPCMRTQQQTSHFPIPIALWNLVASPFIPLKLPSGVRLSPAIVLLPNPYLLSETE